MATVSIHLSCSVYTPHTTHHTHCYNDVIMLSSNHQPQPQQQHQQHTSSFKCFQSSSVTSEKLIHCTYLGPKLDKTFKLTPPISTLHMQIILYCWSLSPVLCWMTFLQLKHNKSIWFPNVSNHEMSAQLRKQEQEQQEDDCPLLPSQC